MLRSTFPRSLSYDLLKTDLAIELAKRPALLRERLPAQKPEVLNEPIILDEVQKVPGILDEVHWLIENRGLRFVLCGSSAPKLRRSQANLLVGRAWRYELFPLVAAELVLDWEARIGEGLYSPDSTWLVFREGSEIAANIYAIRPGVDSVAVPVAVTDFQELAISLSPDGRWLAYASNRSDRK